MKRTARQTRNAIRSPLGWGPAAQAASGKRQWRAALVQQVGVEQTRSLYQFPGVASDNRNLFFLREIYSGGRKSEIQVSAGATPL